MLGADAGDDDDKGASGAAHLDFGAAQRGDEEAANDGGVDAGLRGDAGGDGEGDGERQGDEADGDSGDQVLHEGGGVIGAERLEDFRAHG